MRGAGPQVIAQGKALSMRPGGMHVMLTGLKAPLRAGSRLPLTLRFARAGIVRTSVPIQMSAPDDRHANH
jgi:copper(I)-binding protein